MHDPVPNLFLVSYNAFYKKNNASQSDQVRYF